MHLTTCKHAVDIGQLKTVKCDFAYYPHAIQCPRCPHHTEGDEGRNKLLAELRIQPKACSIITPEQRATIESRRAICEPCPQNKGLGRVSVRCDGCGCAGLSLLSGSCKLGKWSTDTVL